MSDGFIDTAAQLAEPADRRIYGVVVTQVIDNIDLLGKSRVQVRLPWLSDDSQPWARVAALSAGGNRGTYFVPQVGDEVLVAFHHGDELEPYIIGSLWNDIDQPPAQAPTDAVTKRLIRTPQGHEIAFDDTAQSITITNAARQTITMDASKIEITTDGNSATLTLTTSGEVTLRATTSIELNAPTIKLQGTTLDLQASANASLNGGGTCRIQAGLVRIN